MSYNLHSVMKEHHAYYEVLPYYVLLEERHGSLSAMTRSVQAGFDVDIYGVSLKKEMTLPGLDPAYALGYSELQKLAEELPRDSSCSLKVIPFPSTAVLDPNQAQMEGMLRIRISHWRGLDEPADLPERQALEEVENRLHALGVARR